MTSIKCILALACLAHAAPDDPAPRVFEQNLPSAPHGFVMKEVTLYLTPSQIKALEANQDQKGSPQSYSDEDMQKLEAEIKKQLERQHIYVNDQSNIQRPIPNFHRPPPQVEEPINENPLEYSPDIHQKWSPLPATQADSNYFIPSPEIDHQNPNTKFPVSYSFVKIFTDETVHETPKLQLFHPIPHQHHDNDELSKLFEVRRDPLHGKQYKLIPYEYLPDYSPGAPKPEEVKELTHLVSELGKYETSQADLSQQINEEHKNEEVNIHQSLLDNHNEESHLKYAPNFDDHKHADEYQKFVLKLEKANALARAEAILKSPSVRKEVITKRHPVPIFGNRKPPYLGQQKSQVHTVQRHVWKH